ncbi:hypothetical protein QJS10_CPB19g00211 [Acorus calamus]|uniref:Uncharacterized protein n=1 Tax=Acorus calamus TaxID=4465 RepID=A0AAV9CEY5_ACOCL|nr:hypothetical protein QJS10_CPB19g00211 [Acorus calamus]
MELFRRSWGAEVNYPMKSNSAHNGIKYGASGVDGTGHTGGILAFWKESLPINSCSGCGQAIYLIFQDPKIGPWVISGVYASPNMEIHKQGGAPFRVTRDVIAFRDWVGENGLHQLIHRGATFNWCNNRGGSMRTWELLDRVFLSPECHDQFPSACAKILPRYVSDHAPILVYTEMDRPDLNGSGLNTQILRSL